MTDKLQDYKERQKEWTEISVTQLSTANNLLLTLSTGLLAFCFDKSIFQKIHMDVSQSICWTEFFYVLSICFLGFSILFGIAILFTRLYDFRISRHLAQTRKRVYDKTTNGLPDNDLGTFTLSERIKAFYQILFSPLPFISLIDAKNYQAGGQTTTDFNNLRRLASILGSASWRWTKLQAFLFFLSVLCYIFSLLHFSG